MSRDQQSREDHDPKARADGHDLEAEHDPAASQRASNAGLQREVQKKKAGGAKENAQSAAARGVQGPRSSLPHADKIQSAFGNHDISGVQAHVGHESAHAMGAEAYATGNHVVFGRQPDLHTAAHEVAHVVQQRSGVQLKGGVGQANDTYEQNADAVADRVVAGKSATDLLGGGSSNAAGPAGAQAVQKKDAPTVAEAAHQKSDQDSYNGVRSALTVFAKQMHLDANELDGHQKHPSVGDQGDGETRNSFDRIYKRTASEAARVSALFEGSRIDAEHMGFIESELAMVKGGWEALESQLNWGWDYIKTHGTPGDGSNPYFIKLSLDTIYDKSQIKLKDLTARAEPTEGMTELDDSALEANVRAAESAAASVKVGNDSDQRRIVKSLQECVSAASGRKGVVTKYKARLKALEAELQEIQTTNHSMQPRFVDAHAAIQTLLAMK